MARNAALVESTKKQVEVFNRKVSGEPFTKIAMEMKIARSTAIRYFDNVINELKVPEDTIREWRILVNHRLDMAEAPLLQAIADHMDGGPKLTVRDLADAARAIARVEDRRAKMNGIDKPTKIDITHHLPAMDPEQAAKRQKRRLQDAGFVKISTAPPKVIDVQAEEVNDDGAPDS